MKISNNTGKSKDFYNKGKEMFDRIQPLPMRKTVTEEDDDTLVYKKPWVNLTIEEIETIAKPYIEKDRSIQSWGLYAVAIEAKLKEKNA